MSKKCIQCNKKLGFLENYGDRNNPLCFDCADKQTCEECGKKLSVIDQTNYMGRKLCSACGSRLSQLSSVTDDCFSVSAETRKWVDSYYDKFLHIVGGDRFLKIRSILPTQDFFPHNFDGSYESALSITTCVCSFMNVNPEHINLYNFRDQREDIENSLSDQMASWSGGGHISAAGVYSENVNSEKINIGLKKDNLSDPISLIATSAHEISHYILLKLWKFPRDNPDMEPVTDLLTIFLGFGIFTANSAIQFRQFQDYQKHGWSIKRHGYLDLETIGYSIAKWIRLRKEIKPDWIKYLCTDAKTYCNQTLKWL
jgi:hypothetical protein